MLELLQYEHFRKELVNAQCAKFIDEQQILHWQHYSRKRMRLQQALAEQQQQNSASVKWRAFGRGPLRCPVRLLKYLREGRDLSRVPLRVCVRVISARVYVSFPSGDGWAFFSFINFFKETRLINTHFCNWFCSVENLVRGLLTVLIGSSWNIVLRTLPFRYLTKRVAPKSVFRRHFPWRINVLKCS